MRRVVFLVVIIFGSARLKAQSDSMKIAQTVEKYIRSFYESKPEWFQEAVHTGLAKRTVRNLHGAGDYLKEGNYEEMTLLAEIFDAEKNRFGKESKAEVSVYDIEGNFSSAKIVAEGWFDYLHLAKMNGEWKIVNILWGSEKLQEAK